MAADRKDILDAVVAERGGLDQLSAAQFAVARKLAKALADDASDPRLCIELEKLLPPRLTDAKAEAEAIFIAPDGVELTPSAARLWRAFVGEYHPQAQLADAYIAAKVRAWRELWTEDQGAHGRLYSDAAMGCGCASCTALQVRVLDAATRALAAVADAVDKVSGSPASLRYFVETMHPEKRAAIRTLCPDLFPAIEAAIETGPGACDSGPLAAVDASPAAGPPESNVESADGPSGADVPPTVPPGPEPEEPSNVRKLKWPQAPGVPYSGPPRGVRY